MWKLLFVLVLLLKQNLISSEQETHEAENIREPRQLNFGDCCPCPTQDVFQDQDSANTRINTASVDDCPCRSPSDTVGASSIFSPAFRAVEPFIKPLSKKEEPKPLLNPEVGLASSVLQTLQEVTDQEYQEALARDAARSALKLNGLGRSETEPRDVVILSPEEQNNDEMISQATEFQGPSCVLPPLGANNNFEPLRLQPPINLLKQILTPVKFRSNRILNTFDMDGGHSINQNRILPIKHNIFENMKTRSNFLNLRPFSYTDHRDILTSPNVVQKYEKNNVRDRLLSRNTPLLVQTTQNKLSDAFTKTIDDRKVGVESDLTNDFNQHLFAPYVKEERTVKVFSKDNIPQSSDCKEINTSLNNDLRNFDVVPSSSNTVEVKDLSVLGTPKLAKQDRGPALFSDRILDVDTAPDNYPDLSVSEKPKFAEQDRGAEICSDNIIDVDTATNNYSTLQATTDINIEVTTEKIVESAKAVDERTSETQDFNTGDMEPESSITKNIIENLQDLTTKDFTPSNGNKNAINSLSSRDTEPFKAVDKDIVTSNTLPSIKADIFRTLENFKKANEIIQDKLRSNVKDALQLVIVSEPPQSQTDMDALSEMRASSMESTQKPASSAKTNNNISTQDLQKMSDSLLELNSLKGNSDTSTTSTCKEELIEEFDHKSSEVNKVSDMTTLKPTKEDLKSNFDTEHIHKNDETLRNICNNIISKNAESSITNNDEIEMSAQPSNTAYNSISQLDFNPKNLIIQPENKINDVFNHFKYLGTDKFTNENNDSAYLGKQPLRMLNNDKHMDSSRSSTRSYSPSFNTNSKLSSYKTKVQSPTFLEKSIVPALPNSDNEPDVLGYASQRIPHTANFKNVFSNVEDRLSPALKSIHKSKLPQNTLSSIAPSISKDFQPRANDALKTIRDSLNYAEREPFTINKNSLLGRSLINPDNLFGAVLKTHEDFNNKLQDFHSDLSRRLSSLSRRIPSDNPRLLTPSRLKNLKNGAESNNLPNKIGTTLTKPVSLMKNTLQPKNRPIFETLQKKSITSMVTPRPNIKQKLNMQQKDSSTKKGPITLNPPKRNNIKLKPLKESKVTISFATTSVRPDILRSRTNGESVKLPKLTKSFLSKQILPKSNEPKVLASDISESIAQLPNKARQSEITKKVPSQDSSEITLQNDNRRSTDKPEIRKSPSSLLSKLKNGLATGVPSYGTKRNNKILPPRQNEKTDTTLSATNNIDSNVAATSLVETLKEENHSFKCKMVCIKDILDSADTYNN